MITENSNPQFSAIKNKNLIFFDIRKYLKDKFDIKMFLVGNKAEIFPPFYSIIHINM